MIITNKLAKYRSGNQHSLEMFKLEPAGHLQKKWRSKDGKIHLVHEMNTMHLWFAYRMLLGIIETEQVCLEMSGEGPDYDSDGFISIFSEIEIAMNQADIARNAIQYIGHELYKREMSVPSLPEKDLKKKINRADNLHRGFADQPGELLNYDDDE
jgi:hypothetical protein